MFEWQNSIERWEIIPEFPHYSVSDRGRIRNDETDRILKPAVTATGVLYVGFYRQGRQHKRYLPPIVAEAFVDKRYTPDPDIKYNTPMHINGDKTDCRAVNLEWVTRSQAIHGHKRAKW